MALASPRGQPPTAVQQLTPPSSAHGGRGSWDFAVPLNDTKTAYAVQNPMSEDEPSAQPHPPRQPLTSQPNGVYNKPPRSNTMDSQRQYYEEEAYLVPNQVNELQRKPSDITANGSDPDSVLDLYKTESKGGSKNGSQTALNNPKKKKKGVTKQWQEAEKDEDNWIHRDKLKEIESRELEAAGFRVGRTSRSNSRSQSASRGPRGRKNSEFSEPSINGDEQHQEQRRQMVSPIPAAEDEDAEDDPAGWDLRTPEEIAADREFFATARSNSGSHIIRPSTSRIPIAKLSPAPVPNTFVERDAPLPRSRNGSGNWNGDAIATNGARVRGGSVSSQVLLDEPRQSEELLRTPHQTNFSNPTSPITGSPPKAKVPGKAGPTSGARKTSALRSTSQAKPRVTSTTSPIKRPGTSGGSISRPTTGHRPEGEAPWIATMYKPDPRLPPDQQIIPTHAKRMQQDQWEVEGKHGSMYDREFRLLNTEEFKDKRASQISPLDPPIDDSQWPLPSPTKQQFSEKDKEPKSPVNEQGGYKLTPMIPQSPRVPSRSEPRRPSVTATSPKPNTTRVPDLPQGEEKEKKGCCCIVM